MRQATDDGSSHSALPIASGWQMVSGSWNSCSSLRRDRSRSGEPCCERRYSVTPGRDDSVRKSWNGQLGRLRDAGAEPSGVRCCPRTTAARLSVLFQGAEGALSQRSPDTRSNAPTGFLRAAWSAPPHGRPISRTEGQFAAARSRRVRPGAPACGKAVRGAATMLRRQRDRCERQFVHARWRPALCSCARPPARRTRWVRGRRGRHA